jgi:hypothetical protein
MTLFQGNVFGWADKSGKGNNAKNQLPTKSPTLTPANAKFKGRPTLHFDGTQYLYVLHNASIQLGNGDFLMAAVVSVPSGAHGLETIFAKRDPAVNTAGPGLYITSTGGGDAFTAAFSDVESTTKGLDNGSPHYIAAHRTGTTLVIETDGTTAMTTIQPLGATTGDGVDLVIGVDILSTTLENYLIGDLGEVVIATGTVSVGDDAALHQYMKTKYGM